MSRFAAVVALPLVFVCWFSVVADGVSRLWDYSSAPGQAAIAADSFPNGTTFEPAGPDGRLLMFLHPKCPCSRASVSELARILSAADAPPDTVAVFFTPADAGPEWPRTDLWRAAAAIPQVSCIADPGGRLADQFGAATSGTSLYYDGEGRRTFSGGVTAGRGHCGDSLGGEALLAALNGVPHGDAAVYGCSLQTPTHAPRSQLVRADTNGAQQ
ncbi:RedB protein [Alienimonas chondri]|uniref:RedB protein n=1 Tax=Alienimonas chondri TaxID=2681879 RepID=A0ABX1VET3_9PLAN|nr:RedB protein [Alienimonas chondri]NNJ26298.1 hypothetical protein [Alienimonas chondri]